MPRHQQREQLGNAGGDVDDAQARHRAADVVVGHDVVNGRYDGSEVVALPEARPRDEYEEQPDLEQQCYDQKPTKQGLTPHFACAFES